MSKKLQVVLNINTGTVSPRTNATDENPVIFRRIDNELGKAIDEGRVNPFDIVEKIEQKERNVPGFSWRDYDAKRRAAEKLLNVSRREMIPVSDDPNEEKKGEDDNAEVLSMQDFEGAENAVPKAEADADTKGKSKGKSKGKAKADTDTETKSVEVADDLPPDGETAGEVQY